jgi:hypothetical protein
VTRAVIAINLNEFSERAAEHKQKLADVATLRDLLKESRSHKFLEANKAVHSAVRAAMNAKHPLAPRPSYHSQVLDLQSVKRRLHRCKSKCLWAMPTTAKQANSNRDAKPFGRDRESEPIIQAGAYGEEGLLQILEVRAAGGQREILVDACSRHSRF